MSFRQPPAPTARPASRWPSLSMWRWAPTDVCPPFRPSRFARPNHDRLTRRHGVEASRVLLGAPGCSWVLLGGSSTDRQSAGRKPPRGASGFTGRAPQAALVTRRSLSFYGGGSRRAFENSHRPGRDAGGLPTLLRGLRRQPNRRHDRRGRSRGNGGALRQGQPRLGHGRVLSCLLTCAGPQP